MADPGRNDPGPLGRLALIMHSPRPDAKACGGMTPGAGDPGFDSEQMHPAEKRRAASRGQSFILRIRRKQGHMVWRDALRRVL